MNEPRRAPRPSSAQWHAGLLNELLSIIDSYPPDAVRRSAFESAGAVSAEPDRGPGWYRTRRLSAADFDRIDHGLLARAAGPERHYAVLRAVRDDAGDLVQVQPGAPEDGLRLYLPRVDPVRRYRRLLRGLGGPEAVKPLRPFARGDLDLLRRYGEDVGAHTRAVAAAATAGLHAVWAPPATGATTVIVDALAQVISSGQRCLLVSADPLTVDTALARLRSARSPRTGQVVRVGPIQLPELGDDVALATLAQAHRPDLLEARRLATERVLTLRQAPALQELGDARARLTGFELDAYRAARQRVEDEEARGTTERALSEAGDRLDECRDEAAQAEAELVGVAREVQRLRHEASSTRLRAAQGELAGLPRGPRYWRLRRDLAVEQSAAQQATTEDATRLHRLEQDAPDRAVVDQALQDDVEQQTAGEPQAGSALGRAWRRSKGLRSDAERARAKLDEAEHRLHQLESERDRLAARPVLADGDREFCAEAARRGLPELAERLPEISASAAEAETELDAAAAELEELEQRLRTEAATAEPGVLDAAAVVATTIDRLVDSRMLASRPFDLVIVDRAVAVPLPDVAFAAARSQRTCLLIGDSLQAGPPRHRELERGHYWDHDVFEHFGLLSPRAAQHHPGCVLLDTQRRFGEVVTELVNRVGYQGVLHSRPQPTSEVVWVDTDGLPEARVQTGEEDERSWPTGGSLSRELASRHLELGQSVAVITPYADQARLTRQALDATEALRAVPVGTTAELAGREVDVVVIDTVEDGQGWIARARRDAVGPDSDRRRDALRDVLVGVTRARHTVYLIAGGRAVRGERGTPMGELAQLCADGSISRLGARRVLRSSAGTADQVGPDSATEVLGVQDDRDRAVVDS